MLPYFFTLPNQAEYLHSERRSARILRQAEDIFDSYPEMEQRIREDMKRAARIRKLELARKKQQKALDNSDYIPDLFSSERITQDDVSVQPTGRKPTTPVMVFCSLILAASYKGFDSKDFELNFPANVDLISFAERHNDGRVPSGETLRRLCNNELSEDTKKLFFHSTLRYAEVLELDDFSHVIGDSTFVPANSRAASDFETLHILAKGCIGYIEQCRSTGLISMKKHELERLVRNDALFSKYRHELRLQSKTDKEKDSAKGKILGLGRRFCDWAGRLSAPIPFECSFAPADKLEQRLGMLESLLQCLEDGEKTDWNEDAKQLSLSDPEARWLCKGDRSPVFGYMVQVLTSPLGFFTQITAPHDNRSDKAMLKTMLEEHQEALGSLPEISVFDDGYTKKFNIEWCRENGTKLYLKGAKAAKEIPEEEYALPEAREQRRLRSRVEGYINRGKHTFGLSRLSCRGQSRVNKELYRKAALANISLIVDICHEPKKSSRAA